MLFQVLGRFAVMFLMMQLAGMDSGDWGHDEFWVHAVRLAQGQLGSNKS